MKSLILYLGIAVGVTTAYAGESMQDKYEASMVDASGTALEIATAWRLEIQLIDAKLRIDKLSELGFPEQDSGALRALVERDIRSEVISAVTPFFDEMCIATHENSIDVVSIAALLESAEDSEAIAVAASYEAASRALSEESQRLLSQRLDRRRASLNTKRVRFTSVATKAPEHMRNQIASICRRFEAEKSRDMAAEKASEIDSSGPQMRSSGPAFETE